MRRRTVTTRVVPPCQRARAYRRRKRMHNKISGIAAAALVLSGTRRRIRRPTSGMKLLRDQRRVRQGRQPRWAGGRRPAFVPTAGRSRRRRKPDVARVSEHAGRGPTPAVNAKDRIGKGPWQNAKGVVIAKDVAELHGTNNLTKQTALTEKGDGGQWPRRHAEPARHPDRLAARRHGVPAGRGQDLRQLDQGGTDGAAMVGHVDRTGLETSPPALSWNSSHPSRGLEPGGPDRDGRRGSPVLLRQQLRSPLQVAGAAWPARDRLPPPSSDSSPGGGGASRSRRSSTLPMVAAR